MTVVKKDMLVAVNTETTMECKSTGFPTPLVHWFKGNFQREEFPHYAPVYVLININSPKNILSFR